jgi:uncharacterized protein YdhG (YjbR/CyaY superfamily)
MTILSVDDYIAAQPEAARPALERVRRAVVEALPSAEETISYKMPTYKHLGRAVIYFAGWKRHYSLYPATAMVLEELGQELAAYEVNKGTIRFPLAQPVPAKLIARIARLRAAEEAKRTATR